MARFPILLILLASLAGCAGAVDPYQRPGTISISGVNDQNLRAMLVNPTDIEQGRQAPDTLGTTAAVAVARYRNDNVKALPDSTFTQVGGSAGSGGQGGGGGAGGATGGAAQ